MKSLSLFFFVLVFFTACNNSRLAASKTEKQTPPAILSESLQQKQLNGVDFFARGSAPVSWTVEIDFGNLIRFKSLDGADVNSSAVAPVQMPEKNAVSYSSKTSTGEINIIVYQQACTDALSGEKYNKKVTVTVNDKRYEGCGQYLFDAALNGKWILQKINNRSLQASDFAKGLPEIQFELSAQRLTGHDGCNSIGGGFELLGSKIKFEALMSTKMACPANKSENEFTHLLSNQTVDYYFKEGQLFFYLPDDSIIVFKKL